MAIDWKQLWAFVPDFEEAIVRYALTLTALVIGTSLIVAASASGLQIPVGRLGRMADAAPFVALMAFSAIALTLAIELRASAVGWPVALRIVVVIAMVIAVAALTLGAHVLPTLFGPATLADPRFLVPAAALLAVAASASGVSSERANLRIIVFIATGLLALAASFTLLWLCGFGSGRGLAIRRLPDSVLLLAIASVLGLGWIARWLPDANDQTTANPDGDADTAGSTQLAKVALPEMVTFGLRQIVLIAFFFGFILLTWTILNSGVRGSLMREDSVPVFSGPAATVTMLAAAFLANVWPLRQSSRLVGVLARFALPTVLVFALLVTTGAGYFEYQTAVGLSAAAADPDKLVSDPLSAALIGRHLVNWYMAAVVIVTGLAVLVWWRGRDLRLFATVLAIGLFAAALGPASINATHAHITQGELKPLLNRHVIEGDQVKARDAIDWPDDAASKARTLVMQLASFGGLGALADGHDGNLTGKDVQLPSQHLTATLERIKLDPGQFVRRQRRTNRITASINASRDFDASVVTDGFAAVHRVVFTSFQVRIEENFFVTSRWTLDENNQLTFRFANKDLATFDLAAPLKAAFDLAREQARIRQINRLARRTGGRIIAFPEIKPQPPLVFDSEQAGQRFRLILRRFSATLTNEGYTGLSGDGYLLMPQRLHAFADR